MKTALVLGASRGVGAHIACRLAANGWQVVGLGRRARADTDLVPAVEYVQVDLAQVEALEQVTAVIAGRKPQLIVHNAAAYGYTDAATLSLADLENIFRVNATLPYLLLLRYLTALDPDEHCSCIVINSDSIYHANETSGVYAASKAALRVLTTALAAACRSSRSSVSTLLLGPLADDRKLAELHRIAERRGLADEDITRAYLRRSNPAFVTETLIDLESCFRSVDYIAGLGEAANGMLCRLDGGSAGSLS